MQPGGPPREELASREQARIEALLVERIDIGTNGVDIRLRADSLRGLARKMLAGKVGEAA